MMNRLFSPLCAPALPLHIMLVLRMHLTHVDDVMSKMRDANIQHLARKFSFPRNTTKCSDGPFRAHHRKWENAQNRLPPAFHHREGRALISIFIVTPLTQASLSIHLLGKPYVSSSSMSTM